MQNKTPPEQLSQLRQNIIGRFSDQELRDLCQDMGIDYESLPGEGKAGKARELVAYCERRGLILELKSRVEAGPPGPRPSAPSSLPSSQPTVTAPGKGVDVLLVTVTPVEARAVFDVFTPGQKKQRKFIGNNTYYDLGVYGNARVFMVQSEMGSGGLAGAQATITDSINALHPDSVVMVGIAFGTNSQKQAIGDILVSRQLTSYDPQRVGTDKGSGQQVTIPRGDRAHASPRLVSRFNSGTQDWEGQTVRLGLVLSGEKLADNLEFLKQLL
jgi:nucleoside phosphorylase